MKSKNHILAEIDDLTLYLKTATKEEAPYFKVQIEVLYWVLKDV